MLIPGTDDYQTSGLEVEPNSDRLFIVNLKISDGLVTVIDPLSFEVITQLPVGLGPTNVEFANQKAYVTNLSAKSFSVIDLNSLSVETTYIFPDEFRPKDVVYSPLKNSLYFYSSINSDVKKVNADDFNDSQIFFSDLTTRPTDIEITKDGKSIFMIGTNSNILSIIDLDSETANTVALEYQYLTDGVMGESHYYVAYYRGTGGENIGGVLKIDINSASIEDHLQWEYQVDQMKLTASEELLYAVTPVDSTVQVIETKSMHNITSAKVEGSLKFLAITNNNY
jgi:DNA-binding beta-propeller fold protein YncE